MEKIMPMIRTQVNSYGTLVSESPCKSCHWAQLRIERAACIEYNDCPLKIVKEPVSFYISESQRTRSADHIAGHKPAVIRQKRPAGPRRHRQTCLFEGCKRSTGDTGICFSHRRTVERRLEHGVTGLDLYKKGRGGKPRKEKDKC